MNAKEYLSQAFRLDQKINNNLRRTVSLREIASKGTGSLKAQRFSGTTQHSPMEEAITKLVDLEHGINADIDKLLDLRREMITVFDEVKEPSHRQLLELRYLRYERWEDIAVIMKCSLQSIHCVHAKALMAIKLDTVPNSRQIGAVG